MMAICKSCQPPVNGTLCPYRFDVHTATEWEPGLRHLFRPGQMVCFEKRRESFLAVQFCRAGKSCPNFRVWVLARL